MFRLRWSASGAPRRRLGVNYKPPHIARLEIDHPDAPEGSVAVAPRSVDDLAGVLRYASERGLAAQVVGGGTHSGYGDPPPPDLVISTRELSDIDVWEPEDLTIVVGAGASVADVESRLNQSRQSLVMPENPGHGTIGGAIAAGVSSLRRGRLYSTRERLLEATVVTGDGRIVRSGGRVVKNVTGYDVHRLCVGAFGAMGIIVSVCIKLWPIPPGAMTVTLDDPNRAVQITRPLAVLETDGVTKIFLAGTVAEVESQAGRLGGSVVAGHDWPEDPSDVWAWSLRVPPAMTSEAVARLPETWGYLAVHGVGEIRCSSPDHDNAGTVRGWAESVGGTLVLTDGDPSLFDPWGAPPAGLEIQEKLISQFDPARVINPGRLPGGL